MYKVYCLKQHINEPIREALHTSALIDHVAISDPRNIVDSGILKIALSDHVILYCYSAFRKYMVYCIWKLSGALTLRQHKKITTYQMKDFDEFSSLLASLISIGIFRIGSQSSTGLDSAVEV